MCINSPPTFEPPSDLIVVARNLKAMHMVREFAIRAKSNERIKRASRHNADSRSQRILSAVLRYIISVMKALNGGSLQRC